MTLTLSDLPTPDKDLEWGDQAPDWDLILVLSDALEDAGDLPMAQTLRWLFAWDHWPQYYSSANWKWYIRHPSSHSYEQVCRYVLSSIPIPEPEGLLPTWRRAILPPDLDAPEATGTYHAHYFPTLEEALSAFSAWLPSPSYTPPLLPEFQLTLPRTLTPCSPYPTSPPQKSTPPRTPTGP